MTSLALNDYRKPLLEMMTRAAPLFKRIKIVGMDDCVEFHGIDETSTLLFYSKLHGKYDDLLGDYGIPDTALFLNLLRFDHYQDEAATLTTIRGMNPQMKQDTVLEFEFKDRKKKGTTYRAMSGLLLKKNVVSDKIPWAIDVMISRSEIASITQLSSMLGVVGKTFTLNTEENDLVMTFGGNAGKSHRGSITVKEEISGTIKSDTIFSATNFIKVTRALGRDDIRMRVATGVVELSQVVGDQEFIFYMRGHKE